MFWFVEPPGWTLCVYYAYSHDLRCAVCFAIQHNRKQITQSLRSIDYYIEIIEKHWRKWGGIMQLRCKSWNICVVNRVWGWISSRNLSGNVTRTFHPHHMDGVSVYVDVGVCILHIVCVCVRNASGDSHTSKPVLLLYHLLWLLTALFTLFS